MPNDINCLSILLFPYLIYQFFVNCFNGSLIPLCPFFTAHNSVGIRTIEIGTYLNIISGISRILASLFLGLSGRLITFAVNVTAPHASSSDSVPHVVEHHHRHEDGGEHDEDDGHDEGLAVHCAHLEVLGRIREDGSFAGIATIGAGAIGHAL